MLVWYWAEHPPAHIALGAILRALTPAAETSPSATDAPVRPKSREEMEAMIAHITG